MDKLIIATVVAGILSGCASVRPVESISVPVVSCPAPPTISRPALLTPSLAGGQPPGYVAQAYHADVNALILYSQSLEQAIGTWKSVAADTAAAAKDVHSIADK